MMLIPNAIPAIPTTLILDIKHQGHNSVLEDNVAGRKGKSESSEILTGVAPVLFTMGIRHVRPSKTPNVSCYSTRLTRFGE
jgi:hypothetical protein